MYNNMRSNNTFSRVAGNNQKMGAFYTDLEHCHNIGEMFAFPTDKEVCVLEPSIGDGSAVLAVTKAKERSNMKVFGVELNKGVADVTKTLPGITECLEADFLEGVRIRNNAFSFCFGNPPYQDDDLTEDGGTERTERQFLEKVTNYLCKGGILCWVIPYRSFIDYSNMRFTLNHYEILRVHKFREPEYSKYHQIVMVARKVDNHFCLKQEVEQAVSKWDIASLTELPFSFAENEKIEVLPTAEEKVTLFCKKEFDVMGAFKALDGMGENPFFDDLNKYMNKRITTPRYQVNNLGKPPIPLKKDSLYLLSTVGSGQGLTGSVENNDMHLQRGVADNVEDEEFLTNGDGEVNAVRVTTRTKITMSIIENSGKIVELG